MKLNLKKMKKITSIYSIDICNIKIIQQKRQNK